MKKHILFIFLLFVLGIGIGYSPIITCALFMGISGSAYILKRPEHGLVLSAFFLPFERVGALELGGLTIRVSQVLVILAATGYFARALTRKKINLRLPPLMMLIICFLCVNAASLAYAWNLTRSLIVLGYIIFTFSVVWLLPTIIQDKKTLQKIIYALLIGCFVVCVFGIYQYLGDTVGLPRSLTGLRELYTKKILGFTRVQSTALEPLYFANYLIIPIAISFMFFLRKTKKYHPSIMILLFGFSVLNSILTVSRGGYIALVLVIVIILCGNTKQLLSPKNLGYTIFVSAVVIFCAFRFLNAGGMIDEFITHAKNVFGGASYEERIHTFSLAEEAFRSHPLVGIGPGGFGPFASTHPYIKPTDGWLIVNNETLEILAENGIIGLVLFFIIILYIILKSVAVYRRSNDQYLRSLLFAMVAAFIGILAQYQTFSVLYIMHIWFLVGLILTVWELELKKSQSINA